MLSSEIQCLPDNLPWSMPAYLLLDGVSVASLPRRLYEWCASPDFEVLYLETPLAELGDISPCLICLHDRWDHALSVFQENSDKEWGYLLFSRAQRTELLAHLRWLTHVRHPQGEEMLLRLADPAVMHALLEPSTQPVDTALFGPIEHIVLADRLNCRWHQHSRPGVVPANYRERTYPLTDHQLQRLGDVSFRAMLIRLDAHLREYFPTYQQALSSPQRWQHLRRVAERSYAEGFNSEHDITLYANIFALLGEDALQVHADIAGLLANTSSLTPAQRIEQAADLAYARAQQEGRTPL